MSLHLAAPPQQLLDATISSLQGLITAEEMAEVFPPPILRAFAKPNLCYPHQVFSLALWDPAEAPGINRAPAENWRFILEGDDGKAVAAVEMELEGDTYAFYMLNEGPYIGQMASQIKVIQNTELIRLGPYYELRALEIPELHVSTLWLSQENSRNDIFVPIAPTPNSLNANQFYSLEDFKGAIEGLSHKVFQLGLVQFKEAPTRSTLRQTRKRGELIPSISSVRKSQPLRKMLVQTSINGEDTRFLCEPRQSLLEVLREELGLTGTKEGCSNGNCGACSVQLDGVLVDSCMILAVETEGKEVTTIEGMASGGALHPLQQKFVEHAALQCGICTPGLIVAAKALLEKNPHPTEHEARYWLAGNLCRCTGYDKIIRAVLDAAEAMEAKI